MNFCLLCHPGRRRLGCQSCQWCLQVWQPLEAHGRLRQGRPAQQTGRSDREGCCLHRRTINSLRGRTDMITFGDIFIYRVWKHWTTASLTPAPWLWTWPPPSRSSGTTPAGPTKTKERWCPWTATTFRSPATSQSESAPRSFHGTSLSSCLAGKLPPPWPQVKLIFFSD